jgi:uncharacterized protein YlaI
MPKCDIHPEEEGKEVTSIKYSITKVLCPECLKRLEEKHQRLVKGMAIFTPHMFYSVEEDRVN